MSRVLNNEPVLVLGAPAGFAGPQAVTAGVRADLLARAATEHLLDLGQPDQRGPLVPGGPLDLRDATATLWADGLTVIDADVLAEYDHPHFGRWPAITTRLHGEGRVTYVGTVPGRSLARTLARWLAPAPASGWRDLPASVTATTGTSPDGHGVHVVHNWSWSPTSVKVPAPLSDVLRGEPVPEALDLGPWDVRVLVR